MKQWKDLTELEKTLFIDYCNKKYGEPQLICGPESEPVYINNKLKIVDNQQIIDLLFSYSEN